MSVVSKTTIQRLAKDIKNVQHNKELESNGIYYVHDTENMLKGHALIIGTENTPYQECFYFFEFHFPVDYPNMPPHVTNITGDGHTRIHPNLYACGKVCLSILNTWDGEPWSACQSISSVLFNLRLLFIECPLTLEPGLYFTEKHSDRFNYSVMICSIRYMINMLKRFNSNELTAHESPFEDVIENYDFEKTHSTLKKNGKPYAKKGSQDNAFNSVYDYGYVDNLETKSLTVELNKLDKEIKKMKETNKKIGAKK